MTADKSADMDLFRELEKKREEIVNEIDACTAVLQINKNVGMHGPLLDSEGFPRSDIDVVAVRTARNRIICLNTDHNEVMKQLEVVSSRLLSKSTSSDNTEPMDIAASTSNRIALTHNTPFLTVDQVTPDSPADHAGIRVGDQITRFGSLNASNFGGLQVVAAMVKNTEPKDPIPVTLLRMSEGSSSTHHVILYKPEGPQSLGFHIIPLR